MTHTAGLQHLRNGARGAAGAHGVFPFAGRKVVDDGLQFRRCGEFRFFKSFCGYFSVGKIAVTESDTAHKQAFHADRLEALADDTFRRTATDVDH